MADNQWEWNQKWIFLRNLRKSKPELINKFGMNYHSSRHGLIYSIGQNIVSTAYNYQQKKKEIGRRKIMREIALLKVSPRPQIGLPCEQLLKSSSFAPGHNKGTSSIKLPPLPESSRNSSGVFQAIGELPLLKPSESSPLIYDSPISLREPRNSIKTMKTIVNCVTRCSYKTRTGSISGVDKEQNQDNLIVQANFQGTHGQYLFMVCDGHGEEGHLVSNLIKVKLPSILAYNLSKSSTSEADISNSICESVSQVNDLVEISDINSSYSGSTLTGVIVLGNQVICINVGDSRTVLGRRKGNTWQGIALSNDQKPDRADEAKRILKAGGRVEKIGNGGISRIWFQNEDKPGLAMTRSIGDKESKKIGVICTPEVSFHSLAVSDKFIIIASDGVWDFISTEAAVDIVKKLWRTGKSETCCEAVLKASVDQWTQNSDTVDDITIIILFLKTKHLS